jgi:hypothetical protein
MPGISPKYARARTSQEGEELEFNGELGKVYVQFIKQKAENNEKDLCSEPNREGGGGRSRRAGPGGDDGSCRRRRYVGR